MIKKIVSRVKNLIGVTRSKTWHLYSDEYAGERLDVCFVGSEIQKNFVKKALFPASGEEQYLGVQYFFRLRQFFPKRRRYDLVVAEKLSEGQFPPLREMHWVLPHWVQTFSDIPLTRFNNSFKSDLRLIRKNEFSYRTTSNATEVDRFYQDMYLPLVHQRHGESTIPMQQAELQDVIASGQGEVLLVLDKDSRAIAGMVIDYRGNLPNLWSVGVLNADRELFTLGAIPASYHFCFVHLESRGYSRASLGLCRAFIDDGVLQFKRKFSLQLLAATDRGFLLIPRRYSPALRELLEKHGFIHSKNGRLQLATFVSEGECPKEVQGAIDKKYASLGLFSSEVYQVADDGLSLASHSKFENAPGLVRAAVPGVPGSADARAARYLLRHLMHVRAEKSMLLYGDESSDPECLEVIRAEAVALGLEVDVLLLSGDDGQAEQSRVLEAKLDERAFDLVCEASAQYFYNTPSWRKVGKAGMRSFGLGPLSLQGLRDCVGLVDHHRLFAFAERIAAVLRNASLVRITDDNGSDLSVPLERSLSNQIQARLKLATPHYPSVHKPTGLLSSAVSTTFLGGQLSFIGYTPGVHGTIVIDGYIWPPKSLGALAERVTLEIRKGAIASISGGDQAAVFDGYQPAAERSLEHVCIGLNPGARLSNNLMEAERTLGACNFGFGVYPFHTDGVITKPTLYADKTCIIDRGTINPDL